MRSFYFAIFLFTGAAFAQTDRGTITGTISDSTGAVVASANLEAKNLETGIAYQGAASTTGNYTLAQLPAGIRVEQRCAWGRICSGLIRAG